MLGCFAAQAAAAADCPGHPDALGTSRTLVVDPRAHPLIGTMQYAKTLPLADHEVVLTFDDGPLPKYSNQILDILAAQCVKATFFMVGQQANANPEGVRKVRDAGHTVATHTQHHPSGMNRLPLDRARREIEQGIASVTAALADGSSPAPFFRIPGLARNDGIEAFAESKGLQIWSADFPADDWRHVSSQRVYDLAIQRLEAKGKGILLLHDIQPRTVAALPLILRTLKARGYHIVHVVPATAERPATPTEPQQWQMHPPSETVAISRWPKIPDFVFAGAAPLAAPAFSNLDWRDADLAALTRRMRGVPLSQRTRWPQQPILSQDSATALLSAPAADVFKILESMRVTMLARRSSARHAKVAANPASVRAGATRRGHGAKKSLKRAAHHHRRRATHAGHRAPKQAVRGKKNARSVPG